MKSVYEVFFTTTTTQMEMLWKFEIVSDRLNLDVPQMILSVSLVLLLTSPCIPKNNTSHVVLFREDFVY
jgi:hypothetical protein